jgi:chorismate mutase
MELTLDNIAARLEGLEETIILKLIDRCQFAANSIIYNEGQSGFRGERTKSLLEVRLFHAERMDALFGRYLQPEERPFTQRLPKPKRRVTINEKRLALDDFNSINMTKEIYNSYLTLIPLFCKTGDDKQYGSSVVADVYALQAIAERIHFGALYVAESKFQNASEIYTRSIRNRDEEGILAALTRKEIEEKIINRVREKVMYIQANVNIKVRNTIDPEIILTYYRDYIIPLTKKGEVLYLLNRTLE